MIQEWERLGIFKRNSQVHDYQENEKLFREQILWVFIEIEKKNDNNNQTRNNNKNPLKQNQKTTLKFTRSHKNFQITNAVLSKKTNPGGITIPDFKI